MVCQIFEEMALWLVAGAMVCLGAGCTQTSSWKRTVPPDAGTVYQGGLYSGVTDEFRSTGTLLAKADGLMTVGSMTLGGPLPVGPGLAIPAGTQMTDLHLQLSPDSQGLLRTWSSIETARAAADALTARHAAEQATSQAANSNATQVELAREAVPYNPETTAIQTFPFQQ